VRTWQVPTEPLSLHDWHCPSHSLLQQVPSTQLPEVHCVSAEHEPPLPSFATQAPVTSQYWFDAHDVGVQLVSHAALPSSAQSKSGQSAVPGSVQAPEPLQTEAVVITPAEQLASLQTLESSG